HRCNQAFVIEFVDFEEEEPVIDDHEENEIEDAVFEEEVEISMHAMAGTRGPRTMRLSALVKDHRVVVLVDNGSKKEKIVYDGKGDLLTFQFQLGMRFETIGQCRKAVQNYAIYNGCNISFVRSSSCQIEARCEVGCPWRLYASLIKGEGSVAVKTFVSSHSCHRDLNTKQATDSWVAGEYLPMIRKKPKMKIFDLEDSISEKYGVQPSRKKLYKAKTKALKLLRGTEEEHYGKLRRYIAELQRVDRNGIFQLKLKSGSVFKCFYVGFSALRQGFLQGCRPIIGLDGAFLKTFLGGVLLCAVGKDGNNQIFPLAWAVVDSENESNGKWFLDILFQDLGISDVLGWTFISDQQK
ncbi:Unknown protein, partial [Striga hermonthica]